MESKGFKNKKIFFIFKKSKITAFSTQRKAWKQFSGGWRNIAVPGLCIIHMTLVPEPTETLIITSQKFEMTMKIK